MSTNSPWLDTDLDEHAFKEQRRFRAIQSVLEGRTMLSVAREHGVTTGAVSQWYARYKKSGWDGLRRRKQKGRPRIFFKAHSDALYQIISKSPRKWGFDTDLWTVAMARDELYRQTRTRFSESRVLIELHTLGFSFQKPQVRALEKKTGK